MERISFFRVHEVRNDPIELETECIGDIGGSLPSRLRLSCKLRTCETNSNINNIVLNKNTSMKFKINIYPSKKSY
jgi:hypothetical protein